MLAYNTQDEDEVYEWHLVDYAARHDFDTNVYPKILAWGSVTYTTNDVGRRRACLDVYWDKLS